MSNVEFDLQQGLYTLLSADAPLAALIGSSLFDDGPSVEDGETIYPYVSIGDAFLGEWDTDTGTGFDAALRVHSYSDKGNLKELKDIKGAIYAVLHRNRSLAVTGHTVVDISRTGTQITRTSKGARHGICDYRITLDKL